MSDSEKEELLRLRKEYPALLAENKRLHDLVEQLTKQVSGMQDTLMSLQSKLDALLEKNKVKNKRQYGKKTERYNPRPAPAKENITAKKPRQADADRLAQLEKLPTIDVHHTVAEAERTCTHCGEQKKRMSQDISYQLDRLASSMRRICHIQEIIACPKCKNNVSVAPKPDPPFPKCQATAGLLAHVIVSKYADFTPLYRLERIFAREGAPIPRSTLCNWILSASKTLEPLAALLKRRILQSKVVATDDSDAKVLDRTAEQNIRTGKMTVYLGDKDNPYTLFDFSPNKSFERNKKMFEEYEGYVQADAATGFDALFTDGKRSGK